MHCDRGIVLDWVDGLCFQVVGDQKSRAYVWEGSEVLKVLDFFLDFYGNLLGPSVMDSYNLSHCRL